MLVQPTNITFPDTFVPLLCFLWKQFLEEMKMVSDKEISMVQYIVFDIKD